MSSDFNPYEAPKADEKKAKKSKKAKSQTLADFEEQAQERIIYWAKALRPWITFFGTLSYIGAVLLVVLGFVAVVSTSSLSRYSSSVAATTGPVMFIFYLLLGVLQIVIGGRLFRFRDSLTRIGEGAGLLDGIADGFERLTSFWSFVGKVTIVVLVLYAVFTGGAFLYVFSR